MIFSIKKILKKFTIRFTVLSLVLILAFSYVLLSVEAQDTKHLRIETFTSNGTFTVPTGVTSATFEGWGGGGGGATNAGAGGGGSYMKKLEATISAGQFFSITVGSGGAAGGSDGGDSIVKFFGFMNRLIALGGDGQTNGGAGGLSSGGTGDSGYDGGDGQQGTGTKIGGGGAGTESDGANGGEGTWNVGTGGDYFGGLSPSNASSNNRQYAAGGGSLSSAQRSGIDGVVMVSYDLDVGLGYPVIKSRDYGHSNNDITTHPISIPTGVQKDDLVLALVSSNGTPTFSGYTEAGWTLIDEASYSSVATGAVFYTIATSTAPSMTLGTNVSESTTHMTFRVSNGGIPITASSTGFSSNANPPSLNTGTSGKYLWIANVTKDASSGSRASASPANYSDFLFLSHSTRQFWSTDTITSTRHLETQTEDPGTFTSDSEEWIAFTIAIPFDGDPGGPGDSIDTIKTLIKGGTTIKGGVTFHFFHPVFRTFFSFLPKFSFLDLYQNS